MTLVCVNCEEPIEGNLTENSTRDEYIYREIEYDGNEIVDHGPWESTLDYDDPVLDYYRCENCETQSWDLKYLVKDNDDSNE